MPRIWRTSPCTDDCSGSTQDLCRLVLFVSGVAMNVQNVASNVKRKSYSHWWLPCRLARCWRPRSTRARRRPKYGRRMSPTTTNSEPRATFAATRFVAASPQRGARRPEASVGVRHGWSDDGDLAHLLKDVIRVRRLVRGFGVEFGGSRSARWSGGAGSDKRGGRVVLRGRPERVRAAERCSTCAWGHVLQISGSGDEWGLGSRGAATPWVVSAQQEPRRGGGAPAGGGRWRVRV